MINRGAIKQPKIVKRKMESGRSGQDYLFDGENGKNDAITVMYRLAPKHVGKLKAIWDNPEPVESPPSKPALALVPQVAKPIIQHDGLTMSSLEIAVLTGKEHRNVIRDIRNMLEELGTEALNFESYYTGQNGKQNPCYHLPRDLTETLITGYSAPLRHAVVVRLRELEGKVVQPAFKVPTTLHGALLLAANLEEQRLALTQQVEVQEQKIVLDKPKVKFYDDFADTGELQDVEKLAKALGTGRNRLFSYLRKHKILIGGNGDNKNMPYQKHIDSGRLQVRWNNYTDPETGEVKLRPRPLFTGKGAIWIREFVAQHGREGL